MHRLRLTLVSVSDAAVTKTRHSVTTIEAPPKFEVAGPTLVCFLNNSVTVLVSFDLSQPRRYVNNCVLYDNLSARRSVHEQNVSFA